jgi:poly(3-hydroxybutyrate) depolymerase
MLVELIRVPFLIGSFCLGGGDGQRPTGFLDRVFKAADGTESKYVVFVPHNYDGKKPYPTILFLHGSGATGTDGRAQVKNGLAPAIRKQEKSFPFIAVFPQSHEGSWRSSSRDGQRAVLILDQVARDFRVDAKRISLTGLSMGAKVCGAWRPGDRSGGRPSCPSAAEATQDWPRSSRTSLAGAFTATPTS